MNLIIDQTDAKLLEILQNRFPLVKRPFDVIASDMSSTSAEVISRISRLKEQGIIRQISAIFNSTALGYKSSLIACRVDERLLDDIGAEISRHEGVSHCYSRDAAYNLWFTMTLPPEIPLQEEVDAWVSAAGVRDYMNLPALKLFKIGVFLRMTEHSMLASAGALGEVDARHLSGVEREAVRILQQDMLLTDEPFKDVVLHSTLTVDELLRFAESFLADGTMRRFAAVLRHRKAGYLTNAMVCWNVGLGDIDRVGELFAEEPAVSHCYRRPESPDWPYPLYTMIHSKTEENLQEIIGRLSAVSGISDRLVLRTIKEYKKSRVMYFV